MGLNPSIRNAYYQKNRARILAQCKIRQAKNRDKIAAYYRKWRAKNRRKLRDYLKRWSLKNPERVKHYHAAYARRARAELSDGYVRRYLHRFYGIKNPTPAQIARRRAIIATKRTQGMMRLLHAAKILCK